MDASAEVAMAEPATLLAAVRERDQVAFTQLVAAHDHELLRLAFVISGNRQAAEDAAQATWERLWRKPPQLHAPEKLRSWLLTVAANEARQASRRRRRGAMLEASAASTPVPPDLAAELVDLQVALGRLSMPERELLALRFVAGLASAEIADHLGVSPEGARTRIHRLLQRLRTELSHD
jgi:RNA polymerase sigma-70 factor (ECF subfamily)